MTKLIRAELALGRHAEAAAACRMCAGLRRGDPIGLVAAAVGLARCVPLVGGDNPTRSAEDQILQARYAEESVELLCQAAKCAAIMAHRIKSATY